VIRATPGWGTVAYHHRVSSGESTQSETLSLDDVRRVAQLSRLALTEAQIEEARGQMGAVLRHMDSLRRLDLTNVEPMVYPSDIRNRMDDDVERPGLSTAALIKLAPDAAPPFVKVPKVLGGGGGA
jgi:aspartyl-tRNA(Asn)/glutamyl-tRNA(Gln) amidotransferase subunit C